MTCAGVPARDAARSNRRRHGMPPVLHEIHLPVAAGVSMRTQLHSWARHVAAVQRGRLHVARQLYKGSQAHADVVVSPTLYLAATGGDWDDYLGYNVHLWQRRQWGTTSSCCRWTARYNASGTVAALIALCAGCQKW